MNAYADSPGPVDPNRRPNVEAILVSTLLVALVAAVGGVGQFAAAVSVLSLLGVWFLALASLVGFAFGVVRVVALVA
ncbi:hypothetical protein SAMN04487948_101329 [Halogranum amylolyticum]|uniref:Uncharacterized protein n=1 Tax=Halogranum amylolyticum TaxID=660520 RepID=A0A1H8N5I8_9EURY|nr:hypothetical protein [Halogranum amylolyticum]SEO24895.1 hypothetical protein SAMN04487948_101329 [Halogranum amylolyticum]